MSQSDPLADRQAAEAVVRHHRELAATMNAHVTGLIDAADAGILRQVLAHHGEFVAWLHDELLPHAHAEEVSLYPAAAELPPGKLLVDGMLDEHRSIAALVTELEGSSSPVRVAAAARALQAVFATHLTKENDLVLPLLVAADDRSLAALLDGMHDILGAAAGPGGQAGGCGAGACGCGGDTDGGTGTGTEARPLAVDARIDVRDLPHGERHDRVLAAIDALPVDAALVLIAPHAPLPLLAEIDSRYAGQVAGEWLQHGPETWQIRLHRQPVGG